MGSVRASHDSCNDAPRRHGVFRKCRLDDDSFGVTTSGV